MKINNEVVELMEFTLKLVSDKTRLKILFSLLDELNSNDTLIEKCVNDIAKEVDCSQSLVSHQLKVLKDGNFVKSRKVGKNILYSLKDEHVREIMQVTHEHVLEETIHD